MAVPPSLEIRRVAAEETDVLAAVADIDAEAFGSDCLALFSIFLMARMGSIWAATIDGEVVGAAVLIRHIDVPARGLIFGVAVRAAWRRQGIGHRLLDVVLTAARQADMHEIELTVAPDNHPAVNLYETRLGFIRQGLPIETPQGPRLVFRKNLTPAFS